VQHRNSVFHSMLKLLPRGAFDRLVDEHGADDLTRSFDSRRHLIALLFARFSGAQSLREIEAAMASHRSRLYHVGARSPARSTFADANARRTSAIFSGLFTHMLASAGRNARRQLGDAVRLIDSTGLRLSGVGSQWSRFTTKVHGAKAHVIFDPDCGRPIYHEISAANVNDITAAKDMPIEAGATYVFDLGYYHFGWWAKLDAADCRIVTRFAKNTKLCDVRASTPSCDDDILSDRTGFLTERMARSRKNPMQSPVREIVLRISTGKTLRLLTNDLDAPAREIADLYKRRWEIELFFRLMKQSLKLERFIGRSENAVRIQVAVALVAFLLMQAVRQASKTPLGFLEAARLVRITLMHRKDLSSLRKQTSFLLTNTRQLDLGFVLP
jgi:IS4 transposase